MSNLSRKDFEDFIKDLSTSPVEKIVDVVADDDELREYLATTAGNIRNGADFDQFNSGNKAATFDYKDFWATSQYLVDWTWKDYKQFFSDCDRKSIAHWAPYILQALVQRMTSSHAKKVQTEIDRLDAMRQKRETAARFARFYATVPPTFRSASVEALPKAWRDLAEGIRKGRSYLVFGNRGCGKTFFGYAVAMRLLQEEKPCSRMEIGSALSLVTTITQNQKITLEKVVDNVFTKSCQTLILDGIDQEVVTPSSHRMLSYLINRRYEWQLQTVLLCHALSQKEVSELLGSSICDRFRADTWKAEIVDFSKMKSWRKETVG